MATYDSHRKMEDGLFEPFKRKYSANYRSDSFRSLTASDLMSLPGNLRPLSSPIQKPYRSRPSSEILQTPFKRDHINPPEAEAIDRWFENIQRYEEILEEVASASLDQGFKDELDHINQWFRCRSDAERTAALYTVVRNASQIQIRFLITVLQQLVNQDPYGLPTTTATGLDQVNTAFSEIPHQSLFSSHSGISGESEYELRKRQLQLPIHSYRRCAPLCNKLSSAISEPDDLRRRNRDLFTSGPLGLSHAGPLYEKALEARAQLQAMNLNLKSGTVVSAANSSISSSSSSSVGGSSGLFGSPRIKTPGSDVTDSTKSLFSHHSSTEWPFSIIPKQTPDDNWSFGSLSSRKLKKKDDILAWSIEEEKTMDEEEAGKYSSQSIQSSLVALEQAQARLREHPLPVKPSHSPAVPHTPPVIQAPSEQSDLTQDETNSDEELSDTSSNKEKPLTGIARRRKRSSAARALKDKIAAETVDFELMKDVQNWLRSLRLHKYGHAFIGLDWRQVILMSDQDMIDAGVNTIGARRKLLKVFENVRRHCEDGSV